MVGTYKSRLVGKKVLVIFLDSSTTTSQREGIYVENTGRVLVIEGRDGLVEEIPISRIIRIKEAGR